MTNYDIFRLINFVANKDQEGYMQHDKFNIVLSAESRNKFDYDVRRYDYDPKARRSLRSFLREETGVDLDASGSASYETSLNDYAKILGMRSAEGKYIEVVEHDGEWYDRLTSSIKAPSTSYPVARLTADDIEIRPLGVSAVAISYIKYPSDPYMDGYIDSNDEFVYLGEGESADLDATSGTGLDGSTSGTYDSSTVEMEWEDEDKLEVAARILGSLGIAYNKQSLVQYSQMLKQED